MEAATGEGATAQHAPGCTHPAPSRDCSLPITWRGPMLGTMLDLTSIGRCGGRNESRAGTTWWACLPCAFGPVWSCRYGPVTITSQSHQARNNHNTHPASGVLPRALGCGTPAVHEDCGDHASHDAGEDATDYSANDHRCSRRGLRRRASLARRACRWRLCAWQRCRDGRAALLLRAQEQQEQGTRQIVTTDCTGALHSPSHESEQGG
jgi:hypothetical protein